MTPDKFDRQFLTLAYEWLDGNVWITCDTTNPDLVVPENLKSKPLLHLNIKMKATHQLMFGDLGIYFGATISGKHYSMYVPYAAVLVVRNPDNDQGWERITRLEQTNEGEVTFVIRSWIPTSEMIISSAALQSTASATTTPDKIQQIYDAGVTPANQAPAEVSVSISLPEPVKPERRTGSFLKVVK